MKKLNPQPTPIYFSKNTPYTILATDAHKMHFTMHDPGVNLSDCANKTNVIINKLTPMLKCAHLGSLRDSISNILVTSSPLGCGSTRCHLTLLNRLGYSGGSFCNDGTDVVMVDLLWLCIKDLLTSVKKGLFERERGSPLYFQFITLTKMLSLTF